MPDSQLTPEEPNLTDHELVEQAALDPELLKKLKVLCDQMQRAVDERVPRDPSHPGPPWMFAIPQKTSEALGLEPTEEISDSERAFYPHAMFREAQANLPEQGKAVQPRGWPPSLEQLRNASPSELAGITGGEASDICLEAFTHLVAIYDELARRRLLGEVSGKVGESRRKIAMTGEWQVLKVHLPKLKSWLRMGLKAPESSGATFISAIPRSALLGIGGAHNPSGPSIQTQRTILDSDPSH